MIVKSSGSVDGAMAEIKRHMPNLTYEKVKDGMYYQWRFYINGLIMTPWMKWAECRGFLCGVMTCIKARFDGEME